MQEFKFNKAVIDDPRLTSSQCHGMQPVTKEFETPWFTIFNRGGYYSYETQQPHVCVLPVVDNNKILLVKAKRALIAAVSFELPAGGMNSGESANEAASREFNEETGILVKDLSRFKQQIPFSSISSRCPNLDYVFEIELTMDEFNDRNEHDDEIDGVRLLSFDEIMELINDGTMYAALPVALILKKIFL